MKSKNATANNDASNHTNVAADPLASLVLLAATHHPGDTAELLEPLGVEQTEIDKYSAENAAAIETMRKTAIAGALLDRNTFASLIRVRVGVKLIETEDPRQLATLVTAAAKLPPWVFGEEEHAAKQTSNSLLQGGAFPGNGFQKPRTTNGSMQEAIAKTESLITKLKEPEKTNAR